MAVGFLLIPVYTSFLTPADYGKLELVLAIATFLSPLIDGGLTSSFWKFGSGTNNERRGEVLFNRLVLQVSINILIIALVSVFSFFKPNIDTVQLFSYYSTVLLINTFLNIVYLNLQSSHRAFRYVTVAAVAAILTAAGNILLVVHFQMGIRGIILGDMLGLIVVAIIFSPWYVHSFTIHFNWPMVKEMYRYGFPLVFGNLAYLIVTTSDRFFISAFATQNDLGLFAYGVKFSSLLSTFIISPFFLGFNPIRWEIYARLDAKQIFANLYRYINSAFVITYFFFVAGGMILGTIMSRNPEFLPGLTILPLMCFSSLLFGLYYFRSMGLLFEKKNILIWLTTVIASVVSLSSNLVLVPLFSYHGAALSSSLAS